MTKEIPMKNRLKGIGPRPNWLLSWRFHARRSMPLRRASSIRA